jgi:hypothetical protein
MSVDTSEPPMISSASVFATWRSDSKVGLDVLLHGECHVRMTDAPAQRLPIDPRIAASGGVAMPDVMQVDLREASRGGQPLEPARDRIGVRRSAVLPAEQHAMVVVVRPEVAALLVKASALRAAAGPASAPPLSLGRPARRTPGHIRRHPDLNGSNVTRAGAARGRLPQRHAMSNSRPVHHGRGPRKRWLHQPWPAATLNVSATERRAGRESALSSAAIRISCVLTRR